MHSAFRLAICAIATLTFSSSALAGGVGISTLGGAHTEKVYFYDGAENQYIDIQMRPTWGLTLEAILGDRDYKLTGLMRFSYLQDAAPTTDVEEPAGFVDRLDNDGNALPPEVPIRTEANEIGAISAGLIWGIWGDPTGFQVNTLTAVGAGILTADSTEYVFAEVAPGVQYTLNDQIQFHASAGYHLRFRKGVSHGPTASAGVRYLFD